MDMMDGSGTTETIPTAGGGLAEIGAMLRRRREEVGQALDAVSAATHIRAHYLKAIEEGRRRELPGTAYMIGYVRTYADYLGFDGNRLITDYHADLAGPRKKTEKKAEPEPAGLLQIQLSPITLVVALLAFGVAGYFAYGYFSDEEPTAEPAAVDAPPAPAAPAETETAAVPPPEGSAPTGAEASPSGSSQGGPTAEAPAFPPATEDQVPPEAEAEIAALPEDSAGDVAEESPPQPEAEQGDAELGDAVQPEAEQGDGAQGDAVQGEAAAGAEATGKIVVRAKLESWIQITNAKKEVLFSRVLRAGETYTVPEEEGLTLTTGNAGGVEITVDGTKLKSLGTVGLVKRDIPLDPQKLKDGSAFETRRVTTGSQ